MTNNFISGLTPWGFWLLAKPLLTSNKNTPDFHRLIGMCWEFLSECSKESDDYLKVTPLSKKFWEIVQIKNKFTITLSKHTEVLPTYQSLELKQLIEDVFVNWPLIEHNPFVYQEAKFEDCAFPDYSYVFAQPEFFECCEFHLRMRSLFYEQRGKEYLLCRAMGIKDPDLTRDKWKGQIASKPINDGILLINYVTQKRTEKLNSIYKELVNVC